MLSCEAWLGVKPYLALWRYFCSAVYYFENLAVGSVGFSLRKAEEYIHFSIKSSWKDYGRKWFYIQLPGESVIKGKGLMPVVTELWKAIPTITEEMKGHIKRVRELAKWRVVPLKNQDAAYTYKGVLDPNRESTEGKDPFRVCPCSGICTLLLYDKILTSYIMIEVSNEEVARWVKEILNVGHPDWSGVPGPYHAENPPPKVRVLSSFDLLLRHAWVR